MDVDYRFVKSQSVDELRKITEHHHLLDNPLVCKHYDNAYILPHRHFNAGVVDSACNGVSGTQACERYKVGYPFDTPSVVVCDCDVIYMGYLKSVFGHCITDNIKRIWFLYTAEFEKLKLNGIECVYVLPEDAELSPIFIDMMKNIGIDVDKWRCVRQNTKFRRIYVPDSSLIYRDGERYWTNDFKETILRIKKAYSKFFTSESLLHKVYFSRSSFVDISHEVGEKDIEEVFEKNGFEIIHPESIPFVKQMQIVSQCSEFVATEGSVSHWVVFCSPNTNVTILRKADYVNTYQVVINEVADVKVTYVDAHMSNVDKRWPWGGPFFLCKTPQFCNFCGCSKWQVPYIITPKYLWYRFSNMSLVRKYISNRRIVKKLERFLYS